MPKSLEGGSPTAPRRTPPRFGPRLVTGYSVQVQASIRARRRPVPGSPPGGGTDRHEGGADSGRGPLWPDDSRDQKSAPDEEQDACLPPPGPRLSSTQFLAEKLFDDSCVARVFDASPAPGDLQDAGLLSVRETTKDGSRNTSHHSQDLAHHPGAAPIWSPIGHRIAGPHPPAASCVLRQSRSSEPGPAATDDAERPGSERDGRRCSIRWRHGFEPRRDHFSDLRRRTRTLLEQAVRGPPMVTEMVTRARSLFPPATR